ncbi:MAG: ATP-binding protein [Campylobacterota bacterium]|nr:ATP-binding protein [Campylobacterota bacterium]
MQISSIAKKLSIDYHTKLIKIFIVSTGIGTLSANIIAPLIVAYILYHFLPHTMIYSWLLVHIMIFVARILMTNRLDYCLQNDNIKVVKLLKIISILTSLTALAYGFIVWITVLHAVPDVYILMVGTIIMALVAGSISTLISLFHLFVIFVFFTIVPVIAAFIYHGGDIFMIFALLLLFFSIAIVGAGHRQFSTLRSVIALEEKREISLKGIERLNKSLRSRVKLEVDKNRKKDEQIFQQSRLAQMGEMISMIAHQWRQPLAAITATSSLLEVKAELNQVDSAIVKEKAKNISDYAQHLSSTIDDFRDFFKPNKGKSVTSYDQLVDSVLKIMESSIVDQNIELHLELNSHKRFNTYSNEVKQVILNLIKNAEDILLESRVDRAYIKISTYEEDDRYILEVDDNGGGIPESIIENIFDPYFSTKLDKNGTGIGLYMSKMIVEEHCGGVLSASNSSKGARLRIILKDLE